LNLAKNKQILFDELFQVANETVNKRNVTDIITEDRTMRYVYVMLYLDSYISKSRFECVDTSNCIVFLFCFENHVFWNSTRVELDCGVVYCCTAAESHTSRMFVFFTGRLIPGDWMHYLKNQMCETNKCQIKHHVYTYTVSMMPDTILLDSLMQTILNN